MIGLKGPTVDDADVRLFRETRAAGLILYRRNFESPAQLLDVLGRLEGALGRRLLVATDHEGGRIVMLGRGVTIFPDNLAVGTAGEESFAYKEGLLEARELRRLGVDLNLGPCLDVLTDRYSPNIGIRSYGKDPKLVARYGVARLRGMTKGGLSACPKHFPGKGHSPLDAHLKLPTITSDWDEMHAVHLVPFFEAIAAGVECVMTSHPVYPRLDPSGVPATFSRRIVDEYLRGEVGFRGVIVSDDLEMGAVSETCPIGEATVRAAAAGHDLLLVCHTEPAQRAAATALVEAYRSHERRRRRALRWLGVADEQEVVAGLRRPHRRLTDRTRLRDGAHLEVVGDDHAAEADLAAKVLVDDPARERRRHAGGIEPGVHGVRRHHALDARGDRLEERHQVHRVHLVPVGRDRRQLQVGVERRMTLAGEVLGACREPALHHAAQPRDAVARDEL